MKLCMMSCMMPYSTPREITEAAVYCGMDAIDWISTHDTDPALLRKISEDAGLKIVAHTMIKEKFLNYDKTYMDDFKASLEDAVIMGAPVMMLPPFPRKGDTTMEEDRNAWIEYYAQAYPLAKQAGVVLTLESTGYYNSPITTADEVLQVLNAVPGLKLTFDHGNTATADDPVAAYHSLKDYIVHMHLKDWKIYDTPQADTTPKRNGKHFADMLIGEGDLDIRTFWDQVDARCKELYVNLETRDFTNPYAARESLKKVSDLLRTW